LLEKLGGGTFIIEPLLDYNRETPCRMRMGDINDDEWNGRILLIRLFRCSSVDYGDHELVTNAELVGQWGHFFVNKRRYYSYVERGWHHNQN